RRLELMGADKEGNGQKALAIGPGQIDMPDKNPDKNKETTYPVHIRWGATLVSSKQRDRDKAFDVWTLTKDACFIDEEHKQELHAQRIQLWLHPNEPDKGGPQASGAPKQKMHKVEAFEKVFASVPELTVKQTDHLLITFRPEVGPGQQLPTVPTPPEEKRA